MSTLERKPGPGDELVGQELQGTYRIVRRVAFQDIATLYEAVHVRLTRKRFWVKVFGAEIDPKSDPYGRFCREVDIATNLGHSHIASVLDFGVTDNGRGYVVVAYMEGEDLAARLAGPEEVARDFILLVVAQVASALQEAHVRGIVHGGLRPETIFLVQDVGKAPRVKLLDFGVSKLRSGVLVDAAYYLSPEQARGADEEVDRTTDLFALGVICYQCLCGAVPFFGGSIEEIADRICNQEHQPLTARNPSLHFGVDKFFAKALAKDKAARFQQMKTFAEQLYKALTGQLVATVMYGEAPAKETPAPAPADEEDTSRTLCDEGPPAAAGAEQGPVAAHDREHQDLHDTIVDGALENVAKTPSQELSSRDLGATLAVPPEELLGPPPEPQREEGVPGYKGQTLAVDVASLVVPKGPAVPGLSGEPGPAAPAAEGPSEPGPAGAEPVVEGVALEAPAGDQHKTMAFDVEQLVEPKADAAAEQGGDPFGSTVLPPSSAPGSEAGPQQASSAPVEQAPPAQSSSSDTGVDVFSETIVPTEASQPEPAAPVVPQAVAGEIEFERAAPEEEERTDLTTVPKPWPPGMKVALFGGIGFVVLFVLVLVLVQLLR